MNTINIEGTVSTINIESTATTVNVITTGQQGPAGPISEVDQYIINSLQEKIDELEQKKLNVDDYKNTQIENLTLVNSSGKILYTIQGG